MQIKSHLLSPLARGCVVLALLSGVCAQTLRTAPLTIGPALEIVHLYNGQWPTGIAVSASGRKFSNFPAGLDKENAYTGANAVFQVAELTGNNSETAYPSVQYNSPPGGAIDRSVSPPVTKGLSNYLLGVQSVVIDANDVLWILDTGRSIDPTNPNSPLLHASPGGTKLVSVDLKTNKITRTITFPSNVAFPQSYFNDVRFDLNSKINGIKGCQGVAYITDSSLEGFNGLVVVDLGTGESWRHLDNDPRVHPINGTVPFVSGVPVYAFTNNSYPITTLQFGADGIAISPDAKTLYWSVVPGRFLYSVPTSALNRRGERHGHVSSLVQNLGEKGISDGLETDSNGIVYAGNVEQNGISVYNSTTGFATLFVKDPRINWVDTMSIATDGYLYFTVNQLNSAPSNYPGQGATGVDYRQKPYVLFRVRIPNGGTKIS